MNEQELLKIKYQALALVTKIEDAIKEVRLTGKLSTTKLYEVKKYIREDNTVYFQVTGTICPTCSGKGKI